VTGPARSPPGSVFNPALLRLAIKLRVYLSQKNLARLANSRGMALRVTATPDATREVAALLAGAIAKPSPKPKPRRRAAERETPDDFEPLIPHVDQDDDDLAAQNDAAICASLRLPMRPLNAVLNATLLIEAARQCRPGRVTAARLMLVSQETGDGAWHAATPETITALATALHRLGICESEICGLPAPPPDCTTQPSQASRRPPKET